MIHYLFEGRIKQPNARSPNESRHTKNNPLPVTYAARG